MFSFRKKVFVSYLLVFLLFIALIFPFSTRVVQGIVSKSMEDRAIELITKIQSAPNNESLVQRLKDQKPLIFFRVSVISNERKVLYDSHTKRLLGPKFSQEYVIEHPEVLQAFKEGVGYNEEYSDILGQKFAYMAKAFNFHGKTYVMRTAFPYKYVVELTHDFEIGFLVLSIAVLLLFSVMTWLIMHRLSSPIDQIITEIKPYQEGRQILVPEIKLKNANKKDDFGRLANTLNSLSQKVQHHINTLTTERNEKEAVLESLIEGVIAIDENMIVTYANNMALKLLGFTKEELLGQNFNVTHQLKCYTLLQRCQQEGKPLTDEIQLKKEGGRVFLDIVAAPIAKNGAVLVLQDKSTHYKILEMRKDFIANASHELKTPITIIRGFAETLNDNPDLPTETTKDITSKIVRNCLRMTTIVKNLLTLADIENIPQSRLVECDLVEIAYHCQDNLLEVYPDAVVEIQNELPSDFHIIADPHLMELAIMNLIENAAKYSNAPAHITVKLQLAGEKVKLSIADKGFGIAASDLEHIFQRFYTVNKAYSRKMGGSGLGLSIVETIVDKHFGRISVESTLGQGSTFTILLPKQLEKML